MMDLVPAHSFGSLEAAVMDRVWRRGDVVTVRDIFEDLVRERQIAYTTVMSTMDNLHRKSWLQRKKAGKAFHYWPTMTREEYSAALMRDALDTGGDSDLVLSFFLGQMSQEDSIEVRAALRRIIEGGNLT